MTSPIIDLDNKPFLRFQVPFHHSGESTVEIFEIYNQEFQWKAVAQSFGYLGSLGLLTELYGLKIKEVSADDFTLKVTEGKKQHNTVSNSNEPVDKKIEVYKEKLLDLSKRNPLINMKPKSIVELIEPKMSDVFSALIENNKTMIISPKFEDEEFYHFEDNEIISNKPKKELTSLLYRIKLRAISSIEEQGVNILFLALGVLTWSEKTDSEDKFISPILLVPVELIKESINSPYKVKFIEDEIIVNPALNSKLQSQFAIKLDDLPEDLNILSLDEYFLNIQKKVMNIPNQKLKSKACLGIFSFNKLVMYNDLETYSELIKDHNLLNGKGLSAESIISLSECKAETFDDKISSLKTFQVLDADSSQQEAIMLAKKGVSFVLQGPPGTGKSQTITNMIAECIADGKSVLFVSEKMAALEVVKERMENCGLGDFCFELHSNKASKKQVIAELESSLLLTQKSLKQNVEEDLKKLDRLKEKLNIYIRNLHAPKGELGISTFEVQSILTKLYNTELFLFDIPNIFKMSTKTFEDIKENLNKLSKLNTVFPDIEKQPWKNISLESLTLEKESLIKKNMDEIIDNSSLLENTLNEYIEKTSLKKPSSLSDIEKWLKAVDYIFTTKQPFSNWLKPGFDINKLVNFTNKISKDFKIYKGNKSKFLEKYENSILESVLVDSLKEEYSNLFGFFGANLPETFFKDEVMFSQLFTKFKSNYEDLDKNLQYISQKISVKKTETFIEVNYLIKLVEYINVEPQFQDKWSNEEYLRQLLIKVDDIKAKSDSYLEKYSNFSSKYNKELLSLDIPTLLQRFETEYRGFFRGLNPVYKADLKQIADLLNNPSLKYPEALDVLKKTEILTKEKKWFDENRNEYLNTFGSYYRGENTDWQTVRLHIDATINIIKWFAGKEIPNELKSLLKEGGIELQKLKDISLQLKDSYNELKETIEKLKSKEIKIDSNVDTSIDNIAKKIFNDNKYFTKLWSFYKKLKPYIHNGDLVWDTIDQELNKAKEIIIYEKSFKQMNLEKIYLSYFKVLDTDWDLIQSILEWTIECRNKMNSEDWVSIFENIDLVYTAIADKNELFNKLTIEYKSIKERLNIFNHSFQEFLTLFINSNLEINGSNINELSIDIINNWFINLKNTYGSLREWFTFKEIEQFFINKEIPDFISHIIKNKVAGENIINAFNKRFYLLWLDNIFKTEPLLRDFNGDEQNNLINEFTKLDLKSLEISKARLQVILRNQIPKQDLFDMQTSERGILNTEITKKRKHKSLRRLFAEIKNLLFILKPCFMMSPVSVCQFIDPEKIKFDLVVFDEASQIFPEDAVSAILRANQAIIVGDKKQMPPSNFFRFVETDNGDEFSDDDVPEYESILEEFSNMGLPSKMLQWHYRSKDELLIAFSNKHFYDNRLWTFPNKVIENKAIEFIKVDGIYDRGGRRDNRVEALKIADLVFEHFKKHRDKLSLGVITFSEAQQMAILSELERKRMEDQSFEEFFESKENDRFFVKSIEHVQGDERDVIFFSIGYGKDQNNKMYYSFGPINLSGGERRLNVAVTRAKQHIKLVSSMSYNDLDSTKLNSRGSQLLRNYLEYAERGKAAIFENQNVVEDLVFDSPFEEHVYDELIKLGYTIRTQVGSSGYRIDMAVVDPERAGSFLLGIECDGATYHSSKTARDRDRLRQQVLEGLGWKIHRIWSRDWVLNQESEINKIKIAIDEAKKFRSNNDLRSELTKTEDLLSYTKELSTSNQSSFKQYTYTNIGSMGNPDEFYLDSNTFKISNAIYKIISQESPVHISSIIKRITSSWGMTKAGAKIQSRIKNIVSYLNEHTRLDNEGFLWNTEMKTPEVRIPGEFRDIDEICKEEFAEAALYCLNKSFSAEREELIKVIARLFEFNRITINIRDKINQGIELYLTKKIFIEEDNIIKVRNK